MQKKPMNFTCFRQTLTILDPNPVTTRNTGGRSLNSILKTERRSYSRIPFHAEILMQSGHEEWSCNLLDISLRGMLVEPPENLDIALDRPCAMALFLGEAVSIHARVRIIRNDEDTWGLQWLQIDLNSLQHLRRLLELNTNDPELLTRELSDLGTRPPAR